MFRILKRLAAYFIDMLVVLIVVQTITSIPFINRNLDKYNDYFNEYIKIENSYVEFKLDLVEMYEDNELDEEEYQELIEDNSDYEELVNKYYKDNKLKKKDYELLIDELESDYNNNYKNAFYKLDKYSICYNVSYIVVAFLYFVLFNMITNGATLGKKLFRFRIVNNKDINEKVSVVSYLIRFILLYQPIYYLFRLIGVNFIASGNYYDVINVVYSIHSYLEFAIITFVLIRLDGRGLHDILSNTRVAMFDRNGKEIENTVKRSIINVNKES